MSKYVRYTCAKKDVPVLRKDCKKCSEYDPCARSGKWCFVGALIAEHDENIEKICESTCENITAPTLRDMSVVTINLGQGTTVDVLKEDIKTSISKYVYDSIGLRLGG